MNPKKIPCRMCQAGPGEPCKYKGALIPAGTILGGHDRRTPKSYRCYHYKRVLDARTLDARTTRRPIVKIAPGGCRWRA